MKETSVLISAVLILLVWPVTGTEKDDNAQPITDISKCISGAKCGTELIVDTTATTANTTNITNVIESKGSVTEERADKQGNETDAAVDSNDKAFDVYLEKYMADNPHALVLKRQPNGQIENAVTELTVNGGSGIEVVVHLLDANPASDYIIIKSGFASPESSGYRIMAPIIPEKAQKFRLFNSKELYIRFYFAKNASSNKYKGYVITYQPIGEVAMTTTVAPENTTAPVDKLHTITVVLHVPKANHTGETWSKFRRLLMASANLFIRANNMSVEECKLENVTLVEITRCPIQWPGSQNCLRVRVAIPLNPKLLDHSGNAVASKMMVTLSPTLEITDEEAEKKPAPPEQELTTEHLREMWLQFGQTLFAAAEFPEFEMPDHSAILAVWTSISLGVVMVFLLVLVAIWKMEVFQDYRRMSWKHSDDQQHIYKNHMDIDISMFPSPHQIVPSLFPGDANTVYARESGRTGLPFEYVSQPISFNESDFNRRSANETVQNERDGVEVPFQPDIIDFNEPQNHQKIYLPDDDIAFHTSSRAQNNT